MLAADPTTIETVAQIVGAAFGAAVLAFLHFLRRDTTVVNGHVDKYGKPKREPGMPAIYSKLEEINHKVTRVEQRVTDHIDEHRHDDTVKAIAKTRRRVKAAGG